jgi:hypothetical protein
MNNLSYCWGQIVFRNCVPVLLVLFCIVGPPARADRLHFTDGETLSGSFKGIQDGKVSWSSPILGDLVIEQFHINLIESGDHFDLKTSGQNLSNCWMYVQREKQHLHCAEGVKTLTSWKLVVAAGETLTEPLPVLAQKGEIKVVAEDSSGNNNISKYNVDARSEWRYIESRHTFALLVQEESAESQTTRNMWRGSYQYDQFFTDQWFATGNAFYEEDEFRDIDYRTSGGLGLVYMFI